ncbi:MAG: glycosyltransferase, partial [Gemmatimonadetes bacterium]|nr:glycosyltransferase [Gemmatimonadota bacterium]
MASTLHVALYHPAVLPVRGYGGTERVVVWLARGLAALGHRVTVLALPGSNLAEATTIPIDPTEAFRPGGA